MTRSDFLRKFETVLDRPPATPLSGSETCADLGWDSLAVLTYIAMVHRELGVTLAPEKIYACQTVSDLVELVADRLEP